MSKRYQAGFVRPGYDPLKVPNAPTIGTASDSKTDGSVSVAFTAPSCIGGSAITSYTAVANCGAKFASGATSPITVTGLANCTAYTFKVYANNSYGPSVYSAASNSVTPTKVVVGQQAYTVPGTYSWVAPTGVTSVSVVAVGAGGQGSASRGGGGGGLAYRNAISVTPGNSYAVKVGTSTTTVPVACEGTSSFTVCGTVVRGNGGGSGWNASGAGGTASGGTANYSGGSASGGGGGGAAGYAGNGGGSTGCVGSAGSGGGGGGGVGGSSYTVYCPVCGPQTRYGGGSGGGGVGLFGQGTSGTSVSKVSNSCSQSGGIGGSSGANGGSGVGNRGSGQGGAYGGGGGGCASGTFGARGGYGAVRIIWPGTTRSFPSTNTGNL